MKDNIILSNMGVLLNDGDKVYLRLSKQSRQKLWKTYKLVENFEASIMHYYYDGPHVHASVERKSNSFLELLVPPPSEVKV